MTVRQSSTSPVLALVDSNARLLRLSIAVSRSNPLRQLCIIETEQHYVVFHIDEYTIEYVALMLGHISIVAAHSRYHSYNRYNRCDHSH